MNETFSNAQVKAYLTKVGEDLSRGRIDAETLRNDFSFHRARIEGFSFDMNREVLTVDVACKDWLKANTGTANPYLPSRLIFHDVVQLLYRNHLPRTEVRIHDLQVLTVSERLLEAKALYTSRRAAGGRPIALDVQMPLEDTELVILCAALDVHVGGRVVTVAHDGN